MANGNVPQRIYYPPPSAATGELYRFLVTVAGVLNAIPTFSYTSYDGGPNSNLTGNAGDICINIVTSAQTKRLYVKELGSGNTGWVSFSTTP